MKRIFRSIALMALVLGVTAQTAEGISLGGALDRALRGGRRAGPIFRLDVGPGISAITAEKSSWDPPLWEASELGFSTLTSFGIAPTDKIVLMVTLRYNLYGELAPLGVILGPMGFLVTDWHGVAGVGASYYFRNEAPSPFIELGIANGNIENPFDDREFLTTGHDGPAWYTGVGYEFIPHIQAELGMHWSENVKDDRPRDGKWTASTFTFTIGVMLY